MNAIRKIRIKWQVWCGKAVDIWSKSPYPANVLSNLHDNEFYFDGVKCGSMEGFLQSLKQKDVGKQRQVCRMTGREAKRMTNADWQTNQTVWWNGQVIDRQSDVFLTLIKNAYKAMFEQNECFRTALMGTRGKMLYHSQGEPSSYKTILTPSEFCGILMDLRDSYDFRDKTKELNEQREQSRTCSGYAESREKKVEDQLEEKSIRRKKLMYLHGFGSSAASGTVKTLRELLPDFDVVAPDIPVDPAEALPFLRGLCMNEVPDVVVGTSMGGMYAQQMRGYNRICVNPAFEMSTKSKMLTVGTHEYFKPRKDGTTHFEITSEIICHHAEMEKHQFDGITEADRKQVWGMFADNDQQVNGESLFLQYYNQVIHFSGEHRMDDKVTKDVLVPLIRSIVK
ncbi:MAG: hypothetical protein PUD84_07140 [Paraprevotella sp.]|nr:hypothetical protein [Paraprevotella sp.]